MNPLVLLPSPPQLNQATVFTLITSFFSTQIALFRLEKQDKNCWTKTCNHCYQNMTFQWTGRFFARTIARTILSRFYQKLKGDFLKFGVFATWTQIHLVIEWVREGVCICKLCFGICVFVFGYLVAWVKEGEGGGKKRTWWCSRPVTYVQSIYNHHCLDDLTRIEKGQFVCQNCHWASCPLHFLPICSVFRSWV